MTRYDAWLSTNRAQEAAEAAAEAFEKTDEYMSAYIDYCDDFVGSKAYDEAFARWANQDDIDEVDFPEESYPEDFDGMAYYGLHLEDEHDYIDPYGDC